MLTLEVCVCVCVRVNVLSIVTQQDLHNQRKTGHIAKPVLKLRGEVHTFVSDHKQPRGVSVSQIQGGCAELQFLMCLLWAVEHAGPLQSMSLKCRACTSAFNDKSNKGFISSQRGKAV